MATLRATLDASGMQAGARVAEQALEKVEQSAQATNTAMQGLGTRVANTQQRFQGFSNAAAGVGGVLGASSSFAQVGREVSLIGTNLQSAGFAAFALSTGLLEIGRVASDMRELKETKEGAAKGSSLLARIWKAHPLLLISGGIAAAASAFVLLNSLLGDNAKEADKAAEAAERLARALDQQKLSAERRALLERVGAHIDWTREQSSDWQYLVQQATDVRKAGAPMSYQQLRAITDQLSPWPGVSDMDALMSGIRQQEGLGADVRREIPRPPGVASPRGIRGGVRTYYEPTPTQYSAERAALVLEEVMRRMLAQVPGVPGVAGGASALGQRSMTGAGLQPGAAYLQRQQMGRDMLGQSLASMQEETRLLTVAGVERQKLAAALEVENIAREHNLEIGPEMVQVMQDEIELQNQLIELRRTGEEVGRALGSSFFDFVNGVSSARQAVAGLVEDLVRLGQQLFVEQIANQMGGLFSGFGGGPALQDRGTIPGGVGPQQVGGNSVG